MVIYRGSELPLGVAHYPVSLDQDLCGGKDVLRYRISSNQRPKTTRVQHPVSRIPLTPDTLFIVSASAIIAVRHQPEQVLVPESP